MTTQVRRSVFETNSSSSHSLTLGKAALVAPMLFQSERELGVVEVPLGRFGWEQDTYNAFHDKLSYVVTQIATMLNLHYDMEQSEARAKLYADPRMVLVSKVVREFAGVELEVAPTPGYVDHQSVGLCDELFADEAKLRQFLFDETSLFETDNDNH